MKNIKFEITERDIQEYLKQHKQDESIKYREAMFVKYMKEQQEITCESLEILMKKYNWEDRLNNGTYQYDHSGVLKQESLPNFTSYLNGIHNLNLSGICHIMIPVLTYYNVNNNQQNVIKQLENLAFEFKLEPLNLGFIEVDAIENYVIAYGNEIFRYNNGINLYLSKEKSSKLIQGYTSIYGEEPVKQIRKIIRERMK